MPMPIFDDRPFELMRHREGVKPFGKHDYGRGCGKQVTTPDEGVSWVCTREKGHMGRHEAGYPVGNDWRVAVSWADRPE